MMQSDVRRGETSEPFGGGQGEDAFKSLLTEAMAKEVTKSGGIGLAAPPIQREMLKMQGSEGVVPWPSPHRRRRSRPPAGPADRTPDRPDRQGGHGLRNHRPHEAAQYVEETAKLANVYRHESMRVRANVALVGAATPSCASA
jgi:Rod binding domain-containing protein